MRRLPAPLAVIVVGLAVAGCSSSAPSPSASPTEAPTATPSASTPAPTASGVAAITGTGSIPRGTYATPAGFVPPFTFELRADGWQSITPPDQFGFVLAVPNAFRPDVLLGVLKPTAETADDFSAELASNGLLDETVAVEDIEVGGAPARSYAFHSTVAKGGFTARSASGDVQTSFGGDLADNRFVFVTRSTGAFVVVVSLGPNASLEEQFVIDTLFGSISFG